MSLAFGQVRGRIAAARLVLAEITVGSEMHKMQSSLQGNAVRTLLANTSGDLDIGAKANLATMVAAASFCEVDAVAIVSALQGHEIGSNRRPQQDMVAFLQYVSSSEWEIAKHNIDAAIQTFAAVLVYRLGCVNATEYTMKRVAAGVQVLICSETDWTSEDVKKSILSNVKTVVHKMARMRKKSQGTVPYIVKLPGVPSELEAQYPDHVGDFKVDGCWVPPPLNMNKVIIVEAGLSCRNRPGSCALALQQPQQMQIMQMMQQMQSMMNRQPRRGDPDDDLVIEYADPSARQQPIARKRCLRHLVAASSMNIQHPRRSFRPEADVAPDAIVLDQKEPAPAPALAALVPDALVPVRDAVVPAALAAAALVPVADHQAPAADDAKIRCDAPAADDGNRLLDAMIVRDKERAEAAAEKKAAVAAEKKAAVAAEKAAVVKTGVAASEKKAAVAAEKAVVKTGAPSTRVLKPENAIRRERERAAKAAAKKMIPAAVAETPPAKKFKKAESSSKLTPHTTDAKPQPKPQNPCVSHELSRRQFLARSATDGSKTFRYGKGHAHLQQAAAKKAADLWLEAH